MVFNYVEIQDTALHPRFGRFRTSGTSSGAAPADAPLPRGTRRERPARDGPDRADFKIVDQGKPETILVFRQPAPGPAAPLSSLEHSNRPGGMMPHNTVILFDLMNENLNDRLDTWKALGQIAPATGVR